MTRHLSPMLIVPLLLAATSLPAAASDPIALHPQNPHYFLWRDKPTILITSGEHYGAVLNRAFDFETYLTALQGHGFNLTRTFSGAYCEPVGAFKIENNTLAPARDNLLCPWARSDTPGYPNGGNKFDLNRWDSAYFQRLTDFVAAAAKRGIVVELVLFCPLYTLKNGGLLAVQDAMVRRIVDALTSFDNVYYEICNEPYFGGVTEQWQGHIAQTVIQAETTFPKRHLIAQNIANKSKKIENPNPTVSIFNFHYAKPPVAVTQNYPLNKAIGDDETGFAGEDRVKPYRLEAWDFLVAGGAVFSNLDYSFTVGHEQGNASINAPGGGGPELRRQLQILKEFMQGFDFIRMKPDDTIIKTKLPKGVTARALSEPGQAYAIYINGNDLGELALELPTGEYQAEWLNTKTGQSEKTESFKHDGGQRTLPVPHYIDDIALRIHRPR
ncbi:MAG: glycoside hydrolase family 5 protein [Planctomycetes bacterium]|nr:glycoside hydrolase family 5 protein [Planctomycetota bacterium]